MAHAPDSEWSLTAGELIEQTADDFAAASLSFGHGTDNAHDEAAALVFHVMQLDHNGSAVQYQQVATVVETQQILDLSAQRMQTRQPLPYLLGEAWFAGVPFYVDASVLIPRSPIAELIGEGFAPWIGRSRVASILDVGTGCGCIAIACALVFPDAEVVATDISEQALAVAARNVARYDLDERVRLLKTDHMDGVAGSFDLIVSNPPYMPVAEIAALPPEYLYEPELGLVSGWDGLDSARRILQDAAQLLSPTGILVLEAGEQWEALQNAYPHLPFRWLELDFGGVGVGLLEATALKS